ncbi:MAG: DUF4376 domain-containing protein [Campylobacter sp.]|uniref:DUF4376 domain-containing protein n=1 Tax=Campylobacter sp. TaxID=205 RepID=UPI002A4F82EF|nr:DUF4376 domain-containing protein [Campylobacter sp.]MDD7090345.1 DUF4376 domain-containing protein [Campylobacteraceae bacterium]MCI6177775.1 DUF4376 domain-containing protein [Campylobacter sp.]MDY3246606.1 DUF4376 domain-containing protein [Campylobacter sp.]MDY5285957.1 DUF4376 domain-containing protein [Campylobacter sp.]MDY6188281.1 DUF4376 domain-containing protein [Campylobacter sp.]
MKYYKFKVTKMNAGTPSEYIARFESTEKGVEVFEAENTFKDFSVVSISDDNKASEIINSQDSNLALVEIELDEFTALKESSYTYKRTQENLQALKDVKLQELAGAFKQATTKTGVTVSGVGIVDAGRSNLQDITGIIETFEESGKETMSFRIADNSFVSVNAEQLKAIKKAIILKGQELYQKKWEIEAKLGNAKTFDEIRAIKVEL